MAFFNNTETGQASLKLSAVFQVPSRDAVPAICPPSGREQEPTPAIDRKPRGDYHWRMNAPADENKPEDLGDQVEELVDDVAEAVDEGVEDMEELGHAMDDAVEDFAEENPTAYRIFMWVFTLLLLIIVRWLCARYYGGQSQIGPCACIAGT